MFRNFLIMFIMLCVIQVAFVSAGEKVVGKRIDKGKKDVIVEMVEKAFGKNKFIKADNIEPSHIEGFKQKRIWVKSPWGDKPYLIYILEDKNLYILGSVFDGEGNNLTETNVGKIKPKAVKEEDMKLNDDYLIGPKDAKVKTVLWIGADLSSKYLFENIHYIYLKNKDKMNLYIKFFPRGSNDYNKMRVLACFKGEAFVSALKTILESLTAWGSPSDIMEFKKARGVTDDSVCDESIITKDIELAATLNLPALPVVFVNGTLLLDNITTENISKLAGVPLN